MPRDPLLVCLAFLLFGIAMLLPWNTWITATEYFSFKFTGSGYESSFENYFTFCFMATYLLGLILMMFGMQELLSVSTRTYSGFTLMASLFILAMILANVAIHPLVYFAVTLVMVLLSGALIGLASTRSPSVMAWNAAGQGLAGVVPAIVQIIQKASHEEHASSDISQIMAYFSVSVIVALLSMVAYAFLPGWMGTRVSSPSEEPLSVDTGVVEDFTSINSEELPWQEMNVPQSGLTRLKLVFKHAWRDVFSVTLSYAITLSIFPSITARVIPIDPSSPGAFLFTQIHFLLYNVADLIGKSLPLVPTVAKWANSTLVHYIVLLRILFWPALLMCHTESTFVPVIFGDVAFMILLICLGFSNGLCSTLLLSGSPQRLTKIWVKDLSVDGRLSKEQSSLVQSRQHLLGDMLVFSIALGVFLGSIISFGLRALSCGCNPF